MITYILILILRFRNTVVRRYILEMVGVYDFVGIEASDDSEIFTSLFLPT